MGDPARQSREEDFLENVGHSLVLKVWGKSLDTERLGEKSMITPREAMSRRVVKNYVQL